MDGQRPDAIVMAYWREVIVIEEDAILLPPVRIQYVPPVWLRDMEVPEKERKVPLWN